MKKCREYRIRVSSFPATCAPLSYAWNWRFSLTLSSFSSSSTVFVHTYTYAPGEQAASPSLPRSPRPRKEGGVKKRGREGFCFRVNAALGLTTRPAGYTCGRLPYLLRPSNKPQTSSRGKGWRGKEYSREILSLVNGRGFSKVGEGEFCANFVFYGIAAASHTCTCSCTRVRLFFSVRCNDNVREGGEGSTCQSESRTFAMVRPGPWNNRFLSRDLSGKWNFRLALAKTLVHIQLIEPLNLISIVPARFAQDFLVDDYARRGWCS